MPNPSKYTGTRPTRLKMPNMEGRMARWYAEQRRSGDLPQQYRTEAVKLTDGLSAGASVLEVAPGPGYLAIEIARLARFAVAGLDLSHSFVEIARENARRSGVDVDFRHGNAEDLPFEAGSFDLIVCQAAFKNFARPVDALDEMHRVLRPGGIAVIQDLSRRASNGDLTDEVRRMALSPLNAAMTRSTLALLRIRAATPAQFERLAAASAFRTCTIGLEGVTMEIRLTKRATG